MQESFKQVYSDLCKVSQYNVHRAGMETSFQSSAVSGSNCYHIEESWICDPHVWRWNK